MRGSITCPRCSAPLRVPADSKNESATCPRCLAELPKSGQEGITATAATAPGSESLCPECGDPVGRGWRYCPNCQEPLWDRGPRRRRRSMELDVRRDNSSLRQCMIVLAVLGSLGIVWVLPQGVLAAEEGQFTSGGFGFALAGLFVIGLISSITLLFSKGPMSTGRAIGLVAFRSLALTGIVILLCLAVIIFLIIACIATDGRAVGIGH
jgi:hypothetical protein